MGVSHPRTELREFLLILLTLFPSNGSLAFRLEFLLGLTLALLETAFHQRIPLRTDPVDTFIEIKQALFIHFLDLGHVPLPECLNIILLLYLCLQL